MEIREGKPIQMPTDDDDCAAWVMDQNRDVRFISAAELDAMPEFVTEIINVGGVAADVASGAFLRPLTVSSTLDQLFKEPQSA